MGRLNNEVEGKQIERRNVTVCYSISVSCLFYYLTPLLSFFTKWTRDSKDELFSFQLNK